MSGTVLSFSGPPLGTKCRSPSRADAPFYPTMMLHQTDSHDSPLFSGHQLLFRLTPFTSFTQPLGRSNGQAASHGVSPPWAHLMVQAAPSPVFRSLDQVCPQAFRST